MQYTYSVPKLKPNSAKIRPGVYVGVEKGLAKDYQWELRKWDIQYEISQITKNRSSYSSQEKEQMQNW